MFPKAKRLSRADFGKQSSLVGKRISSENFSATVPLGGSGYAVVVSKKVAKLAVGRHRIKRRVIAALQAHTLPSALIVYPKASIQKLTKKELMDELELLISRISKK